jgi:hypothetical protein
MDTILSEAQILTIFRTEVLLSKPLRKAFRQLKSISEIKQSRSPKVEDCGDETHAQFVDHGLGIDVAIKKEDDDDEGKTARAPKVITGKRIF